MKNKPVRQHTVPKMLLKRFENSDGKLFELREVSKGWFENATANASVQKNIYTITKDDGSKDYGLENHLGDVEGLASPALDRVESHGVERISIDQRLHIVAFLYWQYFRTRRMRSAVDQVFDDLATSEKSKQFVDNNIEEICELGIETAISEFRKSLENGGKIINRSDSFPRSFLSVNGMKVARKIHEMHWRTEKIHRSVKSFFVCSDTPVAVRRRGHLYENHVIGLNYTDAEIYFPISKSVMLIISNNGGRSCKTRSRFRVDELNKIVIANRHESLFSPEPCQDLLNLVSSVGDFRIPIPEPKIEDL